MGHISSEKPKINNLPATPVLSKNPPKLKLQLLDAKYCVNLWKTTQNQLQNNIHLKFTHFLSVLISLIDNFPQIKDNGTTLS